MAKPMPADNAFLQFPFAPIQMECDAHDLVVEGEIPADLNGTFYRNGPNQRFSPRGDHKLFEGDGMVHAFAIKNGKVDYKNRWVRTAKWNIENKEGRAVVNCMNPFDCDPQYSDFVLADKEGLANTALVWHGGRLLALEEGHQPYELDPASLDSIGNWAYGGKLKTAMTAHPKVCPDTGELIFFCYMATAPFASDMAVYKVDKKGYLIDSIIFPTPYSSMVHDFVITENYIVVPIMPVTGSLERAMEGGPPFAWEPEKGVHIAVLPRHGVTAANVRWLEMDLNFAFHYMNGFDKNGVITIDCCQFEAPPFFPTLDGKDTGQANPILSRWTVDLNDPAARVQSKRIDKNLSEFPQCDPRYIGKQYRHGWFTAPDGKVAGLIEVNDHAFNTVGHFDHQTGKADYYSFGEAATSEAIFVPKSQQAAEGEGYLMSVVTSYKTRTSSLYIFDALQLANGPLAIAHLSHYVPVGFHGTWRPGS